MTSSSPKPFLCSDLFSGSCLLQCESSRSYNGFQALHLPPATSLTASVTTSPLIMSLQPHRTLCCLLNIMHTLLSQDLRACCTSLREHSCSCTLFCQTSKTSLDHPVENSLPFSLHPSHDPAPKLSNFVLFVFILVITIWDIH